MTPNRGRAPTLCKCPPNSMETCNCPPPVVRVQFRNGEISKNLRPADWWKRWSLKGHDFDIAAYEIVT